MLILIDPTSAVDAHTEARIAERLRAARAGRTTVVLATSPLLLGRADTVAHPARGPDRRHRHPRRAARTGPGLPGAGGPGQRRLDDRDSTGAEGRCGDRLPGRRPGRRPPGTLLDLDRPGPAARSLVVLVLHGAAAIAGLAAPWLLGTDRRPRSPPAPASPPWTGLALAIGGCVLVQALLSRYAQYAGHRFGERAVARLREEFVSRTLGLPVSVVERAGTGDLATRSSVDVSTVGTTVRDVVPTIVIASAQLTLLFGAIFLLHPLLGLVALAGLPPICGGDPLVPAAGQLRLPRRGRGHRGADRDADHHRRGRAHRRGAAPHRRPDRARHRAHRPGVGHPTGDAGAADRVLPGGGGQLSRCRSPRCCSSAGSSCPRGMVTLGEVVAAALYLQQAIDPLDRILQWTEQAQRGFASFARVLGVGQVPPEPPGKASAPPGERLVVRGARFSYADGHDVLHGIDLEVRPGERLAVVGPSGAGKSTLARLLAGIDAPRHGVVSIGGCPVTDLDPAERRRRIALVTQEHHVFIGSVRDNLAFAAPDASDEQMRVRAGRRRRRLVRRAARRPRHANSATGPGSSVRPRRSSSRWPGWCSPTRTR